MKKKAETPHPMLHGHLSKESLKAVQEHKGKVSNTLLGIKKPKTKKR